MDDIRKDFNRHETILMIEIRKQCDVKDLTISQLAKLINISRNNPKFYKVLRYLRECGAIEVIKEIGPSKLIKINKKKIRNIIDEQNECLMWFDYFSNAHVCTW